MFHDISYFWRPKAFSTWKLPLLPQPQNNPPKPKKVHINNVQLVVQIWKKLKIQLTRIQFNILAYLAQNILWMLNRLQTTVNDVYKTITINLAWKFLTDGFLLMKIILTQEGFPWMKMAIEYCIWFAGSPCPWDISTWEGLMMSTCPEIMKTKLLICFQFKYFR